MTNSRYSQTHTPRYKGKGSEKRNSEGTDLGSHTTTLEELARSYIGIDILRHLLVDLLGRSANTTASVVMRHRLTELFPGAHAGRALFSCTAL